MSSECHWMSPSFSVFLQVTFTWRILDLWGKKGRRGDEEKENSWVDAD